MSSLQISLVPSTNKILKQQTVLNPTLPYTKTHILTLKPIRRNTRTRVHASSSEEDVGRVKVKWVELLLDPDPNNVVAVGLTGALVWAGLHVLSQLFVVMTAILMAAVKYTFVGVILIFILITLL